MRAYNVFRRKGGDGVYSAVPEDCAIPRFLSARTWAFSGKLDEPATKPVGFDETAAGAGVRFNGFYLFQAFAGFQTMPACA